MVTTRFNKRKSPTQKRSEELVEAILEAAIRICKTKGRSFTTAEISESAGVSVGSLYQYFPNKEAILFALHKQEWQITKEKVGAELMDKSSSFSERIVNAFQSFLNSELNELPLKNALKESDELFKRTDDFNFLRNRSIREFACFIKSEKKSLTLIEAKALAELIIFQSTSFADFLHSRSRSREERTFLISRFQEYLREFTNLASPKISA